MLDLSGPTNGLIILASVALAITQFFYNDLKSRFAEGQTRVKEVFDSNPKAFTEVIKKRYDNVRATKIRTVRYEMSCWFFVLFVCGLIKVIDIVDLCLHKQYSWQEFTIVALLALTVATWVLLGLTAFSLKRISRNVRSLEARVEGVCEQVEAVAAALDKMNPTPN
jgi:hypothetical protein